MELFLGVDIGTSKVKAALYDASGNQYGLVSTRVPVIDAAPGYAEQDPMEVWRGVTQVISSCLRESGIKRGAVKAVACAGQGDGLWCLDKNGQPLERAALWCDNRAASLVNRWDKQGILREFYKKSGTVLWAGSAAPLLAWFKENDPEYFKRIAFFFCCKDWINYKLTGRIATDFTDGSIPFINLMKRESDPGQAELLGLEEAFGKLPGLRESHEIIGYISAGAAEETGLPEGTPVCVGLLDVAANALGAGAVNPGQVFMIFGTTLLNAVVMDEPSTSPDYIGASLCGAQSGQWIRVLAAQAGTPNIDWLAREFPPHDNAGNKADIYRNLDQEAATSEPGSGGVLYLPYLRGERSPFLNPDATAGFLGIVEGTKRCDLIRAAYEGVAFASRHNLDSLNCQVGEIKAAGGGTVSPFWCQLMADITGAAITIHHGVELGTAGAAVIAARATGFLDKCQFIQGSSAISDISYSPNPDLKDRFDKRYKFFRRATDTMSSLWSFKVAG